MAHHIDVERAQAIVQYSFTDSSLLCNALQAPEKLQNPETKEVLKENDGNRPLAQLGQKVLEAILLDKWLTAWHDRGVAQSIVGKLAGTEALARVAKLTGLDTCVKRSERQKSLQGLPTMTSKLVIAAVIGAVWLDSDRNFYTTCNVCENLGITEMTDSGHGVNESAKRDETL